MHEPAKLIFSFKRALPTLDLLLRYAITMVFIAVLLIFALIVFGIEADRHADYAGSLRGELMPPKSGSAGASALPHLSDVAKHLRAARLPESSIGTSGFSPILSAAMFNAADQLMSDIDHFRAKQSSLAAYDQALQDSFAAIAALRKFGHTMSPEGGRQHRIESYLAAVGKLEGALSALSPSNRSDLTDRSLEVRQTLGVLPLFDLSVSDALKELDQYHAQEAILLKEIDRATLARTMMQDIKDDVTLLRHKRTELANSYQASLPTRIVDKIPLVFVATLLVGLLLARRFVANLKDKQGKTTQAAKMGCNDKPVQEKTAQAAKWKIWTASRPERISALDIDTRKTVAIATLEPAASDKPGVKTEAAAASLVPTLVPTLPWLSAKDYHSKTNEHILLMSKHAKAIDHLTNLIDSLDERCRTFKSGLPDTRMLKTVLLGLLASARNAGALAFQSYELDLGLSQIGLSLDVPGGVGLVDVPGVATDGVEEAVARIELMIEDMDRFVNAVSGRSSLQSMILIDMSARVRELSRG